MYEFKNKRIAIIGFGMEGRSAAEFLLARGARLALFDDKPEYKFSEEDAEALKALERQGVEIRIGEGQALDGFDFVLRSPGVPIRHPLIVAARTGNIPVTSSTAIFFELCPAPIVGITGTKGKGTTASLIYHMLQAAGQKAELIGNIGIPALSILDRITKNVIVVYEISSFQLLEVTRSPRIAVVLMVTQDHLDLHGSAEEYVNAKRNIVRYQAPTDAVVANIDYSASRDIAESSLGRKFWVSRRKPLQRGSFLQGENIVIAENGDIREILSRREVALPGHHNIENACAAAMTAFLLEVPLDAIRGTLRTFKGLEHRLQFIREVRGVRYWDDSFGTTPDTAMAAIESFDEPKVLILGGATKGADFTGLAAAIGRSASIRGIVGVGEEWPRIKAAMADHGIPLDKVRLHEGSTSMTEIIEAASGLAEPGDSVILSPACASFGMFQNYKDRGKQFADAVRSLEAD